MIRFTFVISKCVGESLTTYLVLVELFEVISGHVWDTL